MLVFVVVVVVLAFVFRIWKTLEFGIEIQSNTICSLVGPSSRSSEDSIVESNKTVEGREIKFATGIEAICVIF